MNSIKRYLFGTLGLSIVAFTVAIIIHVDVGLYPPETLNLVVVDFFDYEFGLTISLSVVTIVFNLVFVFLLMLLKIKRGTLNASILRGVIPVLLFSIPLGWFYEKLGALFFDSTTLDYFTRLIIFIVVFFISNFGNAMYQVSNIANFPMNDFTEEFGKTIHQRFGIVRMGIDVVVISLALLLYFFFKLPYPYLGWMTIFLVAFSGPSIDFFMVFLRKNIKF